MGRLWQVIDWCSLPVLAVLAVLLFWRGAVRKVPYFLYYVLAGEVVGLVRLWFYDPASRAYFITYYTTDVIIAVFAVLATCELFLKRLFPRFYELRFYQHLFPMGAIAIALVVVPGAVALRKVSLLLMTIHGLEVLRVLALLFFVGLMVVMGRHWSRFEFGIALGLGIQASAVLATSALWIRSPHGHILDHLSVVAYDLACFTWLITFLRPEKQATVPTASVRPEVLEQAREWERTLKDSLGGKKRTP